MDKKKSLYKLSQPELVPAYQRCLACAVHKPQELDVLPFLLVLPAPSFGSPAMPALPFAFSSVFSSYFSTFWHSGPAECSALGQCSLSGQSETMNVDHVFPLLILEKVVLIKGQC